MIRHAPAAYRAEEDSVERLQAIEAILGNVPAVREVILRAPGKVLDLEAQVAVASCHCGKHVEPRMDHLGTDAIASDCGEPVAAHVRAAGRGLLAEIQAFGA